MRYLTSFALIALILLPGCSSLIPSQDRSTAPPPASPSTLQRKVDELVGVAEQELENNLIERAESDARKALRLCESSRSGEIEMSSIANVHNTLGMIWLKKSLDICSSGDIPKAKMFHKRGTAEFKTALQVDPSCQKAKENLQAFGELEIGR